MSITNDMNSSKYWNWAIWLSIFTILFNITEGLFSIFYGTQDESLTLLGFGIDSFIEVLSGIGIFTMVMRIKRNPQTSRSQFERTALRVTGTSFYILAGGLVGTAIYNVYSGHKPESTLAGLIISLISITCMWLLVLAKRFTGRKLNSAPILSDANCTLVCIYMSLVLLASSLLYQLTGFALADVVGALGLIYFSVKEGKEAFEKAKGLSDDCCEENASTE